MNLSELTNGEIGIITKVGGKGDFRKRLTEMGFVKGKSVRVIKNAPLKDPIEYELMGYEISLRRAEAALIEVTTDTAHSPIQSFDPIPVAAAAEPEETTTSDRHTQKDTIRVALIGNPNSGKTTLFNNICGLHEHVGNYSGVTVGAKEAAIDFSHYKIIFTDLPGTYSLSAYSPEEIYVREHLVNNDFDIVVNVVDASNLERNLYLTTQLIDLESNLVIALNMYDELQHSGDKLDYKHLGEMLNATIIPTVAKKQKGIPHLLEAITHRFEKKKRKNSVRVNYGQYNERHIEKAEQVVHSFNTTKFPDRFIAIKILEKDEVFTDIAPFEAIEEINECRQRIEKENKDVCETVFADARYGFIGGALKETLETGNRTKNLRTTRIDRFVTGRYSGFPIFIAVMWAIFYGTFTLGEYPMQFIEQGVILLQNGVAGILPEGAVNDLIVNGILGGVGSVIVFLPNILILFFFISLLEDSGYMARAAFITDKLMHKIGLHGKSFIPLIMGFGCNVPAVMASRIIENRQNRLVTVLITPFMSCSAKLPVYILIVGAFFPEHAGNLLFGIYLLGVLMAILTALLLNKFVFKKKKQPFVMELPPYRMPYLKSSLKHTWQKGSQYLHKMAGVILVAVVIIWTLGYYPQHTRYAKDFEIQKQQTQERFRTEIENADPYTKTQLEQQQDSLLSLLNAQMIAAHQQGSYLGQIGKMIEPAVAPLGFDWKIGVCLTAGIAAKEIIVSTMGVINQVDTEGEESDRKLQTRLKNEVYTHGERMGEKVYNKAVGLSFLVFTLIYFPCIATVSAIRKETEKTKWMLFSVLYSTALAWIVSFIVYRIALLLT